MLVSPEVLVEALGGTGVLAPTPPLLAGVGVDLGVSIVDSVDKSAKSEEFTFSLTLPLTPGVSFLVGST